MRILKFNVDGQSLKKDPACNFSGIVLGTKQYLECFFTLSKEWNECNVVASFFAYGKEQGAAPIVNRKCKVPDEITDFKAFQISLIGVKGDYRITTGKVKIEQEA